MATDDEKTGPSVIPSELADTPAARKLEITLQALERQLVKNTTQQELLNQAIDRGTSGGREYQKVVDDELTLIDTQVDKLRIMLEQRLAVDAQLKAEGIPLTRERIQTTIEMTEATGGAIDVLKEEGRVLKTVTDTAEKFVSTLTGVSSGLAQTITSTLTSGKALGKFAKSVLKAGVVSRGLIGLGIKMAESSIAVAVAIDKQTEAVRKTLGVGKQYDSMLESQIRSLYHYGVGADETAKAFNSLYLSNRQFVKLGEAQKKSLVASTAQLAELGASTETTAEITNNLTKGLGASATEVEGISQYLLNVSDAMGRPVSAVADDFKSASTRLAFYGMKMKKVFEGLEAQSMATGLSVDKLLDVVGDPFDTFEGSAQAVGRLNAILGGPYLNSIDMLNASEEQRVRMLRQSIKLAGVSIDQLGKFEQLTIASALGTDVDTAMKMLRGMNKEDRRRVREQRQLAKAAREAQGTLTKMKLIFFELATTLEPLMKGLGFIVDRFSDVVRLYTQALEKLPKEDQAKVGILTMVGLVGAGLVLKKLGLGKFIPRLLGGGKVAGTTQRVTSTAATAGRAAQPAFHQMGPGGGAAKLGFWARMRTKVPKMLGGTSDPTKINPKWAKDIATRTAASRAASTAALGLGDDLVIVSTKAGLFSRALGGAGLLLKRAFWPLTALGLAWEGRQIMKDTGATKTEAAKKVASRNKFMLGGTALGATVGGYMGATGFTLGPVGFGTTAAGIGTGAGVGATIGFIADMLYNMTHPETMDGGLLWPDESRPIRYSSGDYVAAGKTRGEIETAAMDVPGAALYGNVASNRMDELRFGKGGAEAQALLINALNKNTESNAQSRNAPAQEVNAIFKVDRSMAQAIVKLGLPTVGYVS